MRIRSAAIAFGVVMTAGAVAAPPAAAEGRGDLKITKVVVNHGRNVIVGTARVVTYPITVTVTDDSGFDKVKPLSWVDTFNATTGQGWSDRDSTTCKASSRTTVVCTANMSITPQWLPGYSTESANRLAGVWQVNVTALSNDHDYWIGDRLALFKVKRASKLTAVITPTKVKPNTAVKVTGLLSRADWERLRYYGYANQKVQLQFRKAGTSTYTTVKTVTSAGSGALSTSVRATSSGYWRWFLPAQTATAQVAAAGDYLAVAK